jgi:hypothetical protein
MKPLVFALVAASTVALAAQSYKLIVNGKEAKTAPMFMNDKWYVPVDALKDAGVTVAIDKEKNTVSLRVPKNPAEGGANQQDGQEGKMGEWLFDGIWRFRVISVAKKEEADNPGYKVVVELKNGSKYTNISLAGTGWMGITLVLEDGNSIAAASDAVELRDAGLPQGAGITSTVIFDTDSAKRPDRVILRLDPKGLAGTDMKYTVANPSFRVDVKSE